MSSRIKCNKCDAESFNDDKTILYCGKCYKQLEDDLKYFEIVDIEKMANKITRLEKQKSFLLKWINKHWDNIKIDNVKFMNNLIAALEDLENREKLLKALEEK